MRRAFHLNIPPSLSRMHTQATAARSRSHHHGSSSSFSHSGCVMPSDVLRHEATDTQLDCNTTQRHELMSDSDSERTHGRGRRDSGSAAQFSDIIVNIFMEAMRRRRSANLFDERRQVHDIRHHSTRCQACGLSLTATMKRLIEVSQSAHKTCSGLPAHTFCTCVMQLRNVRRPHPDRAPVACARLSAGQRTGPALPHMAHACIMSETRAGPQTAQAGDGVQRGCCGERLVKRFF